MESMGLGAISEGEWRSLSGMYTIEESDFMAQLLTSFPIDDDDDDEFDCFSNSGIPSTFSSSDIAANNYSYVANNIPMSMDYFMEDTTITTTSNDLAEPALPNNNLELKRETEDIADKKTSNTNISESSKKRSPSSGDDHVRKNRRKSRSKKNKHNGEDGLNGQRVIGCSSDDDSNASKGSATDHQSCYARKRRERINERLKILQNLVPNGTKVDISTMLEEAVQYVKFLQLQIKMLSSNDWMYAPIAYNGMDIGLDLNLNLNLNLAKQI